MGCWLADHNWSSPLEVMYVANVMRLAEIPNLLDEDNLGTLSSWNGGVPGLSHIKTIRVTCDGAILLA